MLSFSLDHTARFLEALDCKLPSGEFTFQTFVDEKKYKRDPSKKHLRKVLNGTFEEHAETLKLLNEQGAGVFVTINATDGRGRKDENIINLRAAFVDADDVDLLEIFKRDPDVDNCYPNILVQSKNGLHAYWLLDCWENKKRFTSLQTALIHKFGTDPEPKDLARVMRLPGFFHMKDPQNPFLVTLEHVETFCRVSGHERDGSPRDGNRRGYRIDRLSELLNLELPDMTPKWQKQLADRPANRPNVDWANDLQFRLYLAEKYLNTINPPTKGSGTAHETVGSACRVGHDFDVGQDAFWPLLREWGAKCSPPFIEQELLYEYETFLKATKYPPGTKLYDSQFNRQAQYRGWLREQGIDVYAGGDFRGDDVPWNDSVPPGVRSVFIEPSIPNLDNVSEQSFPSDYSFEENPLNRALDPDDERTIEDEQTQIKRALEQKKAQKQKRKAERKKLQKRGPGYLVWTDHGDPPPLKKTKDGRLKMRPQHPREIAWHFLNEVCKTKNGLRTLHWHHERFCQWDGVSYRRYKMDGYRRRPAQFLAGCAEESDKTDDEDEPIFVQFKVKQARKVELLEALRDMVALDEKDTEAPCWLVNDPNLPDPREIICCQNGLLDVRNNRLLPPTPAFFSLNSISIAYNPDAPAPVEFLDFLDDTFGEDEESKKLLKWWFGYCMTQDTRFQKMLMLVGESRSGKGVLTRLLEKLVGRSAYCSMKFHRMSSNFALSSALDKSVLVFPDARIGGKLDQSAVVADLLSITGEDPIQVDRKNLDPITEQLKCRIMIVSNEPLKLHDTSGALRNRLLLINFPFARREEDQDRNLEKRLEPELPGILNWAIEGWHELQAAGRFFQPESGIAQIETFAAQSSPMKEFIQDVCDVGPDLTIRTKGLFDAWKFWTEAVGYKQGNQATFGKNLLSAIPTIKKVKKGPRGEQKLLYQGLTVNAKKFTDFMMNNSDFSSENALSQIFPSEQRPLFN